MKLNPYLNFPGTCEEAMNTYAKVLGGKITAAVPYGEGPPDMPVGPEYKNWLMHCWLDVGDQAIMGADMAKDWAPNIDKPKNGFDVTLHFDDADKAKAAFEALSEGGKVVMPFNATFWSPGYGSCIDKFGVPWMVNVSGSPPAASS